MKTVDELKRLLDYLAASDLSRQSARADELQAAALGYEAVPRLPVTFSYTSAEGLPFQPLPNSAIYGDPAAMLYNELVSAWGTSVAASASRDGVGDDLPATINPRAIRNAPSRCSMDAKPTTCTLTGCDRK